MPAAAALHLTTAAGAGLDSGSARHAGADDTGLPLGGGLHTLHVAYVADAYTDPDTVASWSGTPYFVKRALERQGIRFTVIHLHDRYARIARWSRFLFTKLFQRKRYLRDRHPRLLRDYSRQIQAQLQDLQPDVIFAMATAPLAHLETDCPIAFWVDATFKGMSDFYGSFTELPAISVREAEAAECATLGRSALAIYSSQWAADSARANYSIDPQSVHFVNLGANLESAPDSAEIAAIIRQRDAGTCRLLFVGVDWDRKGADEAIAIAGELQSQGVPVHLTIIGCMPPSGVKVPAYVELVGFLRKRVDAENQRLAQYFRAAHFFVLPTRAEAYGLVFCEASAFGVPSIAPDIGGISSIIENGVNGWLLPAGASPREYSSRLLPLWRDRSAYEAMAKASHQVYLEKLTWDAAAARVAALLRKCASESQKQPPPAPSS